MNRFVFLFTLLIMILGLNCNQYEVSMVDPGTINNIGKVSISISEAPNQITNVIATLSRRGFEDRILILTISDSSQSASGEFTNVPIGMWHLKVYARDGLGVVRYSGESDVEVLPGQTSIVELELLPTSGSIEIHVTWGGECTPAQSGLVSWWTGDGTANDIVGSNHGILMNGATYGFGKVRHAFYFDGVDDRVAIADNDNLKFGSFTIEGWIYVETFPSFMGRIFFRGDDRHQYDPYSLNVISDGKLAFIIEADPSHHVDLIAPIQAKTFLHVAATLSFRSDAIIRERLYSR